MNLRDRIGKWALIFLAPFFLMCEDPNQIGAELNPNDENLNTFYKEFTLTASVILSDSIITSNSERLLIGVFDDPVFGRIKATSFTQLGVNSTTNQVNLIRADPEFDSAVMHLHLDWFYGNNFNSPQRIRIVELEDTLFSNIIYKSTRQTDLSSKIVAELDLSVNPIIDSVSQVSLSDSFGSRLFTLIANNNPRSSSHSMFQNDIKGLAFIPDDNMEYIVGIKRPVDGDTLNAEEESFIRLYYHNDLDNYFYDVTLEGNARYIRIETNRSNSELVGLFEPFADIGDVNGQLFIQPGTGVFTKIDMDRLWEFIDSLDNFFVNRAILEIGPLQENQGVNMAPQLSNISMAFVSESNKVNGSALFSRSFNSALLNDIAYLSGSGSAPDQIPLFEVDNTYKAEISNYLQLTADGTVERTDLMIFPFHGTRTFTNQSFLDQMIINQGDIKIKLFYTSVQ